MPEDYDVVLTACAPPEKDSDQIFVMDAPIVGICYSPESKEIRLVVDSKESCEALDNLSNGSLVGIKKFLN